MQKKSLFRKLVATGLIASVALTTPGIAGLQLTPVAAAATSYETTVTYGVNLRAEPSTKGRIYRMLPKGEAVHVMEKVNSYWLKVKTKNGTVGYISANAKYTTYSGGQASGSYSSSKADQVVSLAKSYQGRVSYDFGTRNPGKLIFDCSSFTQFIYRKVGVELKWGTRYQKNDGSAVSKSNLKKGDLVFFDTVGSNNGVINHVGIYIGGGQFIHNTPSKDGLAINSLTSGYWSNHYVKARRVL